jgi:hypothetical protein
LNRHRLRRPVRLGVEALVTRGDTGRAYTTLTTTVTYTSCDTEK